MRAHTPRKSQKELQYSWLQRSTRGKSTCQSIAQQLPGINIFKTIRHWNSKENLSQNHRFSITFGHLLDPWTPSGRHLAAKAKPNEFWTPFLLVFWWIWGTLGYPFGSLLAENREKLYLGHLFFRFLKGSPKNTEKCVWFLTPSNLLDWALVWARTPCSLSTHNPNSLQKRYQKWSQNTRFGHL